jgi:vancomycin resistance protein VanJ
MTTLSRPELILLETNPDAERRAGGKLGKIVGGACWLYACFVVSLWLLLRAQGDRWWVATVFLFGPRWIALTPLALLMPAALLVRRRSLLALFAGGGLALFPVMGLCLPWRSVMAREANAAAPHLRVLTCNIHRDALDADAFASLIATTQPDVIALQEWTSRYQTIFTEQDGWHVLRDEELCLASRYPIRKVKDIGVEKWKTPKLPGAAVCYEITMPHGAIQFVNVHLASPHRAFETAISRSPEGAAQVESNSAARLRQSMTLSRFAEGLDDTTVLAGDFNTVGESPIFRQCWARYSDAFAEAGTGFGYTYFARWTQVRIDHVMNGGAWKCRQCWVGPDAGSPHRAVVADLEWVGR